MAGELEEEVTDSGLSDVQPGEGQDLETPGQEGTPGEVEGGGTPSPAGDFEFEGVQIKGLTPEQRDAIEKGAMRTADYTRKTQAIKGQIEERLNAVHTNLLRDPRAMLQYFPLHYLEHIVGLAKGAHQPDGGQAQIDLSEFEPKVAQVIGGLQKTIQSMSGEIHSLKSTVGQYGNKFSSFDERQAQADLTSELNEALGKYKDLNTEYDRNLILTMIANNGQMSVLDAAAQVSKLKKTSWSQKVNANNGEKTKVVGAGRSTPPVPKAPKTYADADKLINQRLGISGG